MQSRDYPGTYNFDKIFDWRSTQEHVFSYAASATIEDVMRGYNGTIFAYGQTGSGKTHTMMGDMENQSLKGLTPRIVENIFSTIFSSPPHLEFTVRVSYMEIYMEKIRDLLNPANDNLPIHEEKSRGVYVKGLLEVFVGSIEEVYEAMRRGQSSRMTAQTNMNAESSRSHSIFVLTISQKNLQDGSQKAGKLYLVDLAGSEKVGKTGASGQTLEEAKKINKSLSALGMVINALTDGKSSHIPYRDSKLTRILQESLGGNSRTTLIINCSPSSFNESETVSTLRFGMRAKTIKNKAKINAELSPGELKVLLKRCKTELSTLQAFCHALEKELNAWRSGRPVSESDWVRPLEEFNNRILDMAVMEDRRTSSPAPGGLAGPSTPGPKLEDDEREDFLKRENELSDQLADKEAELEKVKVEVKLLTEAVNSMRQGDSTLAEQNKKLQATVADLNLQMEKVAFESKDTAINLDTLRDENMEMSKVIETLKKQVVSLQALQPVIPVSEEDKEKRRKEKMAEMLAEFDPTTSLDENEKAMKASLAKLAHLRSNSAPPQTPEAIEAQHLELLEAQTQLIHQDSKIHELSQMNQTYDAEVQRLAMQKEELQSKVTALEREYEELLERTMNEELSGASPDITSMIDDLKVRLESLHESRSSHANIEIQDLKALIARKDAELARAQAAFAEKKEAADAHRAYVDRPPSDDPQAAQEEADKDAIVRTLRNEVAQQIAECEDMKKKFLKDLQNRCEKVVELELSLDDMRQQYGDAINNNSNSTAQKQKMAFMERNLEQLAAVQKNLVEQNIQYKKEMVNAERKLGTRNERIAQLEGLLGDATMKLELQNQKFEAQLASMRERLQEARSEQNSHPSSSWLYSSRIAKPLRGGGGAFVPAGETEDVAQSGDNDDLDFNVDLGASQEVRDGLRLGGSYLTVSISATPDEPPKSRASWYISLLAKKDERK
ncbi:P-loop containing nucleoside triphosphate hydrolase protein [Fimicolochytrium jonesii]|uniref:P-loop containing nucleoside triphosphate hydrolase protein n=1 Tax=Fimicolochytrium jonesii TaxID=1396493 RepID=UPI0022FE5861|nr:P-loop containing nucleoside triphosphate hydrolase protein [Fimicolochytrium jonesii]KAI8824221.1 P-loop containing nucleoside triphosphate hydrolase protein [Fimicolochytrium jonesii]